MPLINNPLVLAALRRQWPLVGAVLVFLVFTIANLAWVGPLQGRYKALTVRATQLGMAVDPEVTPRTMSPSLMAMFVRNSLDPETATQQATSGQLTATLLEDMTRLASRNGLEVVAAEQGPVTQQGDAVQVRGHLRLYGDYRALVRMLSELTSTGRLYSIERFAISRPAGSRTTIELWVSRYILKLKPGVPRS
jgi:Tfp pilus assembly protein PilO